MRHDHALALLSGRTAEGRFDMLRLRHPHDHIPETPRPRHHALLLVAGMALALIAAWLVVRGYVVQVPAA